MSAYVQTARLYEETDQTEKALKYLFMADSAGQSFRMKLTWLKSKPLSQKITFTRIPWTLPRPSAQLG
jgi:hypothetical protein